MLAFISTDAWKPFKGRAVINRVKTVLLICVLIMGGQCVHAFAEETDAVRSATLNRIIRGEGKPGETATSKNGEVVYLVLEGGIVEIRNTRYNTSQRYSIVKKLENNRND